MGSNVNLGSFGVNRVKRLFSLKCYNSSKLRYMAIRLIHVDQLETLYLCYGVKCQSGVIWGHWGQKVIFTKNAITRPCYIARLSKTHTCWSAWDLLPMFRVKCQSGVIGATVSRSVYISSSCLVYLLILLFQFLCCFACFWYFMASL